jgi:hypothetical protein
VPCDGDSRASTVTDLSNLWQQLDFPAPDQALIFPRNGETRARVGGHRDLASANVARCNDVCCEIFSPSRHSPHQTSWPAEHMGYIRALQSRMLSRSLPFPCLPAPIDRSQVFVVRSLHERNGLETGCHMNSRLPAPAAGGHSPEPCLRRLHFAKIMGSMRDKMRTGRKLHPSGWMVVVSCDSHRESP